MMTMQYRVSLPADYDATIIKERVARNGMKTDNFPGLCCKLYLLSNNNQTTGSCQEYCPIYIWNTQYGMNEFLFHGYYDNILTSFGWQTIQLMVPLVIEIKQDLSSARFLLEKAIKISPTQQMKEPTFTITNDQWIARFLLYDPTSWTYSQLYLYETQPEPIDNTTQYEILHVSMGK